MKGRKKILIYIIKLIKKKKKYEEELMEKTQEKENLSGDEVDKSKFFSWAVFKHLFFRGKFFNHRLIGLGVIVLYFVSMYGYFLNVEFFEKYNLWFYLGFSAFLQSLSAIYTF